MTPRSLLLCVLVLQSFLCTVWCSPVCNNECCRFVEGFPVRLKKLRENFSHIRDFYVSKRAAPTLHRPPQWAQHHLETSSSPTCGRVAPVSLQVMLSVCLSVCLTAHWPHAFLFSFCLQEANDDVDTALLDQSVEESFKVSFTFNSPLKANGLLQRGSETADFEGDSCNQAAASLSLSRQRSPARPWTASWASIWARCCRQPWPTRRRTPGA